MTLTALSSINEFSTLPVLTRMEFYENSKRSLLVDTCGIRTPLTHCKCDVLADYTTWPKFCIGGRIRTCGPMFPKHRSIAICNTPIFILWKKSESNWVSNIHVDQQITLISPICRGGETRTHDLMLPKHAYYQLYYTPKNPNMSNNVYCCSRRIRTFSVQYRTPDPKSGGISSYPMEQCVIGVGFEPTREDLITFPQIDSNLLVYQFQHPINLKELF